MRVPKRLVILEAGNIAISCLYNLFLAAFLKPLDILCILNFVLFCCKTDISSILMGCACGQPTGQTFQMQKILKGMSPLFLERLSDPVRSDRGTVDSLAEGAAE